MKKFIVVCFFVLLLAVSGHYLYYQKGFYLDVSKDAPVSTGIRTVGKTIYLTEEGGGPSGQPLEIRGVDIGGGIPGHFGGDRAIDRVTYLRWFGWIRDMGANTIRVYTLQPPSFYSAVFEYNSKQPHPLYVLHGLWVDDTAMNSHVDAYDKRIYGKMKDDARTLVDVIHGKRKLRSGQNPGTDSYTWDISPWVIGYILGMDWEPATVIYTDQMETERNHFAGAYLYTTSGATPFEALLADVGDELISYESRRYQSQRLLAFSNGPMTDPFTYPQSITDAFKKTARLDTEHIRSTDRFLSGLFASYHVYPYFPDFLAYLPESEGGEDEARQDYRSYYLYLKALNTHHTVPVVISEFGVPSSRGISQRSDLSVGTASKNPSAVRSQGKLSEQEQGEALAACLEDIQAAGCAGSIIFSWQDEWFKETWNTMASVNTARTPYWSDCQTSGQSFGLLAFDPGKETSVCYVDGDCSEWTDGDVAAVNGSMTLSMKYDEKFLYFYGYIPDWREGEVLYIPVDVTPGSGSRFCEDYGIRFDRACDFLIVVDGRENSRVVVQERYDVFRAMYSQEAFTRDAYVNPPASDSSHFAPMYLLLRSIQNITPKGYLEEAEAADLEETGRLRFGIANPSSPDFNSLADFYMDGGELELKLPWQLLNFSDPSRMRIHDDYYIHYGVEEQRIDHICAGIGRGSEKEQLVVTAPFSLTGWGDRVTFHERLKPSYYIVKKLWETSG